MNIGNILNQLKGATNKKQMIMSMITPEQKQMAEAFVKNPTIQQCEEIARRLNAKGITKDDLQQIASILR